MKVKEAIAQGYKVKDIKWQRGYVSRKIPEEEQEVFTAQGRRNGQLYYLQPCPFSTQYCHRVYLEK